MKKQFNISENIKQEWIMKEWGSFEDSMGTGKTGDENHIVRILERSPKNKIVANDEKELSTIMRSAKHHESGSWDTGNPIVEKLMKTCDRILMTKID